jgi:hypothetical protein
VARGEIDAEVAFTQVINAIPWAKLAAVSDSERFWFKPGMFYLFIFPNPLPKSWAYRSDLSASQACRAPYL